MQRRDAGSPSGRCGAGEAVANGAPTLTLPPLTLPHTWVGGRFVAEGDLPSGATDPDGDALTYAWDLDNNGTFETPGQSASFAGLDGPASFTVNVQVTDNGGLTATALVAASRLGARCAFAGVLANFLVISFTSDWLYPTPESRAIVRALNAAGARASFLEIESDKGHDAFLLDEPVMRDAVAALIDEGLAIVKGVRERHDLGLFRPAGRPGEDRNVGAVVAQDDGRLVRAGAG